MAKRLDPSLEYIAGLCRRNAVHVLKLAWTTHPRIGFDRAGVRWLNRYIEQNRGVLTPELTAEFTQFMGCFYGECLIEEFGGSWQRSSDHLGVRMDRLGFTYPFNAVAKQIEVGESASIAASFMTAVEYLTDAA